MSISTQTPPSEPPIDEPALRAAVKFTDPHQPGVRCEFCSHPDNTPWTRNIYHPAGRPHHQGET